MAAWARAIAESCRGMLGDSIAAWARAIAESLGLKVGNTRGQCSSLV